MESLGKHILVEFTGCNEDKLNDVDLIEEVMVQSAKVSDATVINSTFHHFSPFGVSGVVVIQESHLAIHTWPEFGYAAVDLFTCGGSVDAWKAFDYLKKHLNAGNYSVIELNRGHKKILVRNEHFLSRIGDTEPLLKSEIFPSANKSIWFTDKDNDQAVSLRYKSKPLYNAKSKLGQHIKVLDTYKYGRALIIDNMVMTTEHDEYHYHEMITHPYILSHGSVKNVLVIGGGDGGTIREIFKHRHIEKVTMVEIDADVITVSKEFLPGIANSFEHPRLELHIDDGISFVQKYKGKPFDLIIVDGSDPVGPAEGLFSEEFYTNCYTILAKDGTLVTQGESPLFNEHAFKGIYDCFCNLFGKKHTYVSLFYVPTYPTGMWSFQSAGKSGRVLSSIDENVVKAFVSKNILKYYNEHIHKSTFVLPSFVSNLLDDK